MAIMGRPGLSLSQKKDLWTRWSSGQTLSEIGRALGIHAGSVHGVLAASGGIAPTDRKRSVRCLGLTEREEISRGLAEGFSLRSIAKRLNRAVSTVCREVTRNGGRKHYRAVQADKNAWNRALRPKTCLLSKAPALCQLVASKLAKQWSPQQISGWLRIKYEDDTSMQISHETIYKSLFIQARGVLKKELMVHLRSNRTMRRAKSWTSKGQPRGRITDAVSIRDRPADIEDRAVPGHWEGDLISGSKNTHIATLVERKSRYVTLVKLNGKDTKSVINGLCRQVQGLPEGLMQSLTWDRGGEMANHKLFTMATDVQVYFCDPQSPWQRGTNENTNRLLRQYLPKKTDLSVHSQADLDLIAQKLNTRPRKTLGYKTPAAILAQHVAMIS
ncbi:MAG: IS30 family transposase [Robiginitomaculum sp.]|nr:MAG: IS30 family transposase [Robiginitomaculum sp.]